MSTNKIKPSDLTAWSGDKSMAIHAHKPGVSQQVTVQEIIDAVPVPDVDISAIEAAKDAAIDAMDQAVIAKDAAEVSKQGASNSYTQAYLWSEKAKAWAENPKGSVISGGGNSAKHWALTAQDIADAAEVSKQGALSAYNAATLWSERSQAWAEAPRDAVINGEGSSAKHWAMVAQDIADGMSGGGSGGSGGFPGENVDDTISHDIRKAWAAISAIGQSDGAMYDLDDQRGKHIVHPGISAFLGGNMPVAASSSPIIVGWWSDGWRYERHDGDTGTMRVENNEDTQRPSFWRSQGSGGQPDMVHVVGGLYSKVMIYADSSEFTSHIDIPGYIKNGLAILETIPSVDAKWWLYDVFIKGDKTKSPVTANYECVQNLTVNYIKAGDPNGDIVRTFTRKLNGSAGSFQGGNWKLIDSGISGGGSDGGGLPGGDVNDSVSVDIPSAWASVSALPVPNLSFPAYMPLDLDSARGKSILYSGSQPYSGGKIAHAYSTSPCIFVEGGKAQQHVGGSPLNLLPGDMGNVLPYVDRGSSMGWQSVILGNLKSIFYPWEIDSAPVFAGHINHLAIVETTPLQAHDDQDFNGVYDIIVNRAPSFTVTSPESFRCMQELTIIWAPSEGYYIERTPENYAATVTRKYRRIVSDAIGRFEGGNWKLIEEL